MYFVPTKCMLFQVRLYSMCYKRQQKTVQCTCSRLPRTISCHMGLNLYLQPFCFFSEDSQVTARRRTICSVWDLWIPALHIHAAWWCLLSSGIFFASNTNWTKALNRILILNIRVSSLVTEQERAGIKIRNKVCSVSAKYGTRTFLFQYRTIPFFKGLLANLPQSCE